MKVIPETCRAQ